MRFLTILSASAAALGLAAVAVPASAQTQASLGYTQHSAGQVDLGAVTGRVGTQWGLFGVEAEAGFGVKDDTIGATKVELKHHEGVYATVGVPLNDRLEVGARIGLANQEFKVGAAKDSETSINYGAGATLMLSPANGLKLDYTRVDYRDGARDEGDSWSASFVRKF